MKMSLLDRAISLRNQLKAVSEQRSNFDREAENGLVLLSFGVNFELAEVAAEITLSKQVVLECLDRRIDGIKTELRKLGVDPET